MISLSTKADKDGFWYLIDASQDCKFTLSYIVVGSGGRQSSGEISGSASNTRKWQFQAVGFPVLRVGITDLCIDELSAGFSEVPQTHRHGDSLSRRRAIKTFASSFLAGGASLLFLANSASGHTLTSKRSALEKLSKAAGSYNPYGDEQTESFQPY